MVRQDSMDDCGYAMRVLRPQLSNIPRVGETFLATCVSMGLTSATFMVLTSCAAHARTGTEQDSGISVVLGNRNNPWGRVFDFPPISERR